MTQESSRMSMIERGKQQAHNLRQLSNRLRYPQPYSDGAFRNDAGVALSLLVDEILLKPLQLSIDKAEAVLHAAERGHARDAERGGE